MKFSLIFIELSKSISDRNNEVVISAIIPRNDKHKEKAKEVNSHLKELVKNIDVDLVLHDNIDETKHLTQRKLHLKQTWCQDRFR